MKNTTITITIEETIRAQRSLENALSIPPSEADRINATERRILNAVRGVKKGLRVLVENTDGVKVENYRNVIHTMNTFEVGVEVVAGKDGEDVFQVWNQ